MARHLIGNKFRLTVEVKDVVGGYPVDPTGLEFLCAKKPFTYTIATPPVLILDFEYEFGTDPELVKEREGVYYVDMAPDEVGEFFYRWETDTTLPAQVAYALEGRFEVYDTELK